MREHSPPTQRCVQRGGRLVASRRLAPPKSKASGFTLVELVTSVIIVGIMAAVAAPRFLDNVAFNERGYIDEVAFTLRYAQKIAVASGCSVSVAMTAGGYAVTQRSALGNTCNPVGAWTMTVKRTDGSALSGSAPAGVLLSPNTTVVFTPAGDATAPAAINVGSFALNVQQDGGLVTVVP